MIVFIHPVEDEDGIEFLPDEMYTPLYTKTDYVGMTKKEIRNIFLYRAIRDRENYYQDHTPPAFGDPNYSRLDGYMFGLAAGYGLALDITKDKIIVKTEKGRVIMVITRPKETEAYSETVKSNARTLAAFGI